MRQLQGERAGGRVSEKAGLDCDSETAEGATAGVGTVRWLEGKIAESDTAPVS